MRIEFSPVTDEASAALTDAFAQQLYLMEGLPMDKGRERAMRELAAQPQSGGSWVILADGAPAGFLVLTACYSLEFHGAFGLLDEFYIAESWRGKGIGTAALAFIDAECRSRGWKAVRLEVALENVRAQQLYRRAGYRIDERHLMTKWL